MSRALRPHAPSAIEDRPMTTLHPSAWRRSALALALASSFASPLAQAISFETQGFNVQIDTKLSIGAALRMENRDPALVGISNGGDAYSTNGDDGNILYDKHDVVSSAAKFTTDLSISRGEFGAFIRGTGLFNTTLEDKGFFNPANYGRPGKEAPASELAFKNKAVQDEIGRAAELLDAYVYGNVPVGSRTLTFKLGKQALNWGESTLVPNGLNSILALNAHALRVPGVEIEEVILPAGMAWASIDVIENVSAEAFYQIDWVRTRPDVPGSYWATNDFAGVGGTRANIGFGVPAENNIGSSLPRGATRDPSDSGQFGGALRIFLPSLNNLDVAFYAANFHSRLPLISGTVANAPGVPFGATYFLEYPEDIQLYGFSFNTTLPFDVAVQAEYALKVDQPLQIDDVELLLTGLGVPSQLTEQAGCSNLQLGCLPAGSVITGWRRHDVSQVDVTFTKVIGPNDFTRADQTILLLEAAWDYIHELPPESELRYDAPATYTPGFDPSDGPIRQAFYFGRGENGGMLPVNDNSYATAESWGVKLIARLEYNNVIGAIGFRPTLRHDYDVNGVTPTPIGNFVEGRRLTSVSLGWTYLNALSGDVGFTRYSGADDQNLLGDRDFVEMNVKYAF
ncbi:MAG TPA: DUF1302 domain-containing protein [Nevskiaceae bacterium]|nr:DUF1302 domain-containing protein [Nevskiaceae bacterium]